MTLNAIAPILVGIADPEQTKQPAIARAAQLALTTGAPLALFHAAFQSASSGRPFFDSLRLAKSRGEIVARASRALERLAEKFRAQDIVTTTMIVWEEPAHAAILAAATRIDASLIVIGGHARRGQPPALRYTDWQVLRCAARPVLIVRSPLTQGAVVAALDPSHLNDKTAALDRAIAAQAAQLALALGDRLHVAHCIPDAAYPPGFIKPADRKQRVQAAREAIGQVLRKQDLPARRVHIVHAQPEVGLPKLLESLSAQVLVLGALSRRGLKRLAVGNTAERLIDRTKCDLLIVKPPGFKLRLASRRGERVMLPAA